jgi:hypothetical protein
MDFTLSEVTFGKVDTCHRQRALASAMVIPSHASRVQHVHISEYLLIRNCMAIKSLDQFFYYHSKYLNSVKCREISMSPSKCTIQCSKHKPRMPQIHDPTVNVKTLKF